jgi:hypothetical protein
LEKTVPEAYNKELGYILEWRIQIALMEGDEAALERYFYQFSPLAGDKLDTYYRIIPALAYHGKVVNSSLFVASATAENCLPNLLSL